MSDKDEALLGSVLAPGGIVMVDIETTGKLCAMLRSQHARIAELEDVARVALEALTHSAPTVPYEGFGMAQREADRAHVAAIESLRKTLGEPK